MLYNKAFSVSRKSLFNFTGVFMSHKTFGKYFKILILSQLNVVYISEFIFNYLSLMDSSSKFTFRNKI